MILLIDNYDSFVYNLYQFIAEIEPDVKVVRNDEITSEEILKMNPDKIVISPGPGKPSEAGECIHVIRELKERSRFSECAWDIRQSQKHLEQP